MLRNSEDLGFKTKKASELVHREVYFEYQFIGAWTLRVGRPFPEAGSGRAISPNGSTGKFTFSFFQRLGGEKKSIALCLGSMSIDCDVRRWCLMCAPWNALNAWAARLGLRPLFSGLFSTSWDDGAL